MREKADLENRKQYIIFTLYALFVLMLYAWTFRGSDVLPHKK